MQDEIADEDLMAKLRARERFNKEPKATPKHSGESTRTEQAGLSISFQRQVKQVVLSEALLDPFKGPEKRKVLNGRHGSRNDQEGKPGGARRE